MTTFLAIAAGIVTFLITQFVGALLIAVLGTSHQALYFFATYGPTKLLLQVLMWSGCGWPGMLVYSALA